MNAPRPRVAIIAPGFHANAADPFVPYWRDHIAGLAAYVEATVFPLRLPATSRPYRLFGADIVPLARGDVRLRHSPALWRDAVAAVVSRHRQAPFDLVHALQAGEAGLVGALAAAAIRRPLLAHIAGGELVRLPALGYGANTAFERIASAVALRCARVVTVGSEAMLALARRRLAGRAQSARLAPLGIRVERFRGLREHRPGETPLDVLCVANLNPVKDHATLIEALAGLPPHLDRTRLSLVGFGSEAGRLRQLARRHGVAGRVRWWGAVPHAAIHVAYARADVYCSSSRHEAQGIALLEAAAAGLPIAATPVGVAGDLAARSLHLAPVGCPAALANAMAVAAEHAPDDCAALADAVAADYGLAACTRRFLVAYAAASAR